MDFETDWVFVVVQEVNCPPDWEMGSFEENYECFQVSCHIHGPEETATSICLASHKPNPYTSQVRLSAAVQRRCREMHSL